MPKVTMQTLADELGLSKFAVSRALSDKPGISDETRKRVREAARKRGYRRKERAFPASPRICALYAGDAIGKRELWLEIRNGMEIEAARQGFELDFAVAFNPEDVGLVAMEYHGMILVGPHARGVFEEVESSGRPAVAISPKLPPLIKLNQIATPDAETGEIVAQHLLSKGHRHFVFVHGRAGLSSRSERLRGFQLVAHEVSDTKVRELHFTDDYASREFLPGLIETMHDDFRPTAFYCGADNVAVTVLGELQRLGLHVPEDCSLVGYGDYPVASQVTPQLTTVTAPLRDEGIQAIRMMNRLFQGSEIWPGNRVARILLAGEFVERNSTATVGAPDWDGRLDGVVGGTGHVALKQWL